MEIYMKISVKCSNCGTNRKLTKESAYEAKRLGKTLCRDCSFKFKKPKVSKYANIIKSGDVFGSWTVIGNFLGNGSYVDCECECGTIKKIRATKLLNNPRQCRKCSVREKSSNWRGVGEFPSVLYSVIKSRAKYRNKHFNVSKEYLASLYERQNGLCALSGKPLEFGTGKENNLTTATGTASLDRIDSSLGYEEGNVQWVHKHINAMKNSHSTEYFINLCREIVNHYDKNRDTQ